MSRTSDVHEHARHFIGGEWVEPKGEGSFEVIDATTEAVMGRVPAGNAEDAAMAVAAAKAAFPAWSQTDVATRAGFLEAASAKLKERADAIADIVSREVGMPRKLALPVQVLLPIGNLRTFAKRAREMPFEEELGSSVLLREPVGVVVAITPWNYPLHQVVAKVGAALAAGCTVVLKPSEVAPLSAYALAHAFAEVGLPPGVLNLVSGDGATVGEALVESPDVDMVTFTGSTRAGRRVSEVGARTIKRVHLELGGKSAFVILDDADLGAAVKAGVKNCYLNGGQTCSAWTRMLVPAGKRDEAVAIAKSVAETFTVGDPFEGTTRLGPMASGAQRDRIRTYVQKGVEEGATLVTGGAEPPEGLDTGFFVRPTVFADVTPDMTIAREEIFGPVLSILTYEEEDDAVRIANDSIYGLHGGVFSADVERAKRVARRLRTGQVDINGGRFNAEAPFGGYKQSGNGREYGAIGIEEFLEYKSLQL
ncbi:MAG: aldehyde dehydrogenase family protein [Myxococcota bacterium]